MTDQPRPTPNNEPPIVDLVVDDFRARARLGIEKYGTLLQAFNGRDFLRDAYEESLDKSKYLKGAIIERDALLERLGRLENCFVCITCGRSSADEDGCCTTCGRDCIAFENGKLVDRGLADHLDGLETALAKAQTDRDAATARAERAMITIKSFMGDVDMLQRKLSAVEEERDAALREADRLRHGVPIEGDFVCPDSLERDAYKAVAEAAAHWAVSSHWSASRCELRPNERSLIAAVDAARAAGLLTEEP